MLLYEGSNFFQHAHVVREFAALPASSTQALKSYSGGGGWAAEVELEEVGEIEGRRVELMRG